MNTEFYICLLSSLLIILCKFSIYWVFWSWYANNCKRCVNIQLWWWICPFLLVVLFLKFCIFWGYFIRNIQIKNCYIFLVNMKWPSLFLIMHFSLKSILSFINLATQAFLLVRIYVVYNFPFLNFSTFLCP